MGVSGSTQGVTSHSALSDVSESDHHAGFSATSTNARVYPSANQELANASWSVISWASEDFDNGGLHDTVTNNSRFTITADGLYLVVGVARFSANSTGSRMGALLLNGSALNPAGSCNIEACATDQATAIISQILNLETDDYVELTAHQRSGGALNFVVDSTFSIVRLS